MIRFASVARVSTEQQSQRGESLQLQISRNKEAIKLLGGQITKEYYGQQHATPQFEHSMLENMISDSTKGLFDAVIVDSIDRWSRDNLSSKQWLKTLREHQIRFFVGSSEFNLFDPSHTSVLGFTTEASEFMAAIMSKKSLLSRIERAKKGYPSAGNLPFGRYYRDDEWGIDPFKHKLLLNMFKDYTENHLGFEQLGKKYNMNHGYTRRLLTDLAGDSWPVRFRSTRFNIDETITINIPRLLTQEQIALVQHRAKLNRTYEGPARRNNYLLQGAIYCAHCGSTLCGQTTGKNKHKYYRHSKHCEHICFSSIRSDVIEFNVFQALRKVLRSDESITQSINGHCTDLEAKKRQLAERKSIAESGLDQIKLKWNRLISAITDGLITQEQAKSKSEQLKMDESNYHAELATINREEAILANKVVALTQVKAFRKAFLGGDPQDVETLPFAVHSWGFGKKKRLIQTLFPMDEYGIFVKQESDGFSFTAKGIFPGELVEHVNENIKAFTTPNTIYRTYARYLPGIDLL